MATGGGFNERAGGKVSRDEIRSIQGVFAGMCRGNGSLRRLCVSIDVVVRIILAGVDGDSQKLNSRYETIPAENATMAERRDITLLGGSFFAGGCGYIDARYNCIAVSRRADGKGTTACTVG